MDKYTFNQISIEYRQNFLSWWYIYLNVLGMGPESSQANAVVGCMIEMAVDWVQLWW
jgi:hypothetical protein